MHLRKSHIVILIVILIFCLLGWLAYQQSTKDNTQGGTQEAVPAIVTPQPTFGGTDAERLETALNSGDRTKQAAVLTDEFGKAVLDSGQLLGDATVRIKAETFTSNDAFAQVAAVVTKSGVGQEFILSLERQNNQWKIFLIEPKR